MSVAEGKTAASATAPSISPDLWSALLAYENDPVIVRYGYERHNDYFGMSQRGGSLTNRSSRDTGNKLMVVYRFGDTRVGVAAERLDYKNDDSSVAGVNQHRRDAYVLVGEHTFGPSKIWATYAKAEDGRCTVAGGGACTTDGLGARMWAAVYVYALSKRTDVFTMYVRTDNERSAQYGIIPNVGVVAPGAASQGVNIGIAHAF